MIRPRIKCPQCGTSILNEYDGQKRKLRTNILVWDSSGCIAKCPNCKADVRVPVILNLPIKSKMRHVVFS